MMKTMCAAAALAATSGAAIGQVRFNEVMANIPGADNGGEFIELKSDAPSADLTGLTILIIEGDGGSTIGTIDVVLSLDGLSTGSNSLLLWRDGSLVLEPAPDPATTLVVRDFNPDLENGASTWLIVRGFSGTPGQDLDTNDDGVLDARPWTAVLDAVGYDEGEQVDTDVNYAVELGGLDISASDPDPNIAFTPDAFARVCGRIYSMDVLGDRPGPFVVDELQVRGFPTNDPLPPDWTLTPGNANIEDCGCAADFNGDGFVDFFDFDDFVVCFEGGACPPGKSADFNGDGFVDFFDYDDFVIAFEGGC